MLDFKQIDKKWQAAWEKKRIFESDVDKKRKKFLTSLIIPYVNGRLHIGHTFTFCRNDSYARFKRMQGFNVLMPQGFHATGEPIVGAIERLKKGDKNQIDTFRLYGVTDKELEDFKKNGPEFAAKFWTQKIMEDMKSIGFSIDWRRIFITAIYPTFNRFIEWQYNTLRKNNFVTQGTHPVIWCPHDQSPTGDHDRLVGEGESPIEYTIIKYKLDSGEIIPTGTLRPETIYGVTNIWINPDATYMWAKVGDETWLLGEKAVEKLRDQLKKVQTIGTVVGSSLVGKFVENPVTKTRIPILPASFVDPSAATGVVMSVPSHAPYDWVGLHDIQKDPTILSKFGTDPKIIENVKPISIISVEGFGENPAVEISVKMNIVSQAEKEKLEEATSQIYKKEYHTGVMRKNLGEYSGMKVSAVKDKLIKDLAGRKITDSIWEMTAPVVCRCTTECHVKILENQWFLKFSDEAWKNKVKECISQMKFYPEESRIQFLNTVDWMKDKACARKSGLGTKLPWDKEWIVETLSDSTIYMAYYTISRIINEKKIPAESLTDEVFDFIFLGKGEVKKISKSSELPEKILQSMREEFEYFYPVDLRSSGKDLLQNHLTYYLFHHVAIWPKQKWPRAIGVNGFVQVAGEKMSKSKGNVRALKDLIKEFGADIVRMNIVSSNEGMDDADWREENVGSFTSRIEFIREIVSKLPKAKRSSPSNVDSYLMSRLQSIVQNTTENFEVMKFRSGIQSGFYDAYNDLKWYVDRCGQFENCNKKILENFISAIVRLVAPVTPHIAEEIWSDLGNKKFVSVSNWPNANKRFVNAESELAENFVRNSIEDIRQIEKITNIRPKEIRIIISPKWKFDVYNYVLSSKTKDFNSLVKGLKNKNDQSVKYLQTISKKANELSKNFLDKKTQMKILKESSDFLSKQFNCVVFVEDAEDSVAEKAKQADVFKPAIVVS